MASGANILTTWVCLPTFPIVTAGDKGQYSSAQRCLRMFCNVDRRDLPHIATSQGQQSTVVDQGGWTCKELTTDDRRKYQGLENLIYQWTLFTKGICCQRQTDSAGYDEPIIQTEHETLDFSGPQSQAHDSHDHHAY